MARNRSVASWRRIWVGVRSHLHSFLRTPWNVAFVLLLPILIIEGYGLSIDAFPPLPYLETGSRVAMGHIAGAMFAAAFIPAVFGLFQMLGATQTDRRAQLCGYSPIDLMVSRMISVLLCSLVVAGISLGTMLRALETVAAPGRAFFTLGLVGILFGLCGMLVGTLLPRILEGSLVLIFFIDSNALLTSELLNIDSAAIRALPMYYPHEVFQSAVLEGTLPKTEMMVSVCYLVGMLAVTLLVYYVRATGGRSA